MNPDKLLYRVLYIDLSRYRFWTEYREDLFDKYLGGVGVAVKLFDEEVKNKDVDPLSPGNVIVFAIGPLTDLYPAASKTVAVFKSPLTGNYGESHAGGRSAAAIRMAGYGAIVIKGVSKKPVYIAIHGDNVYFRDASALWGMRSSYTVGRVIREREGGAGLRTIMRIGRAGENLVRYASVITETYRHFGRLGLGAVFGSKKLKALVISGRRRIPIADKRGYREVYDEIYKYAVESDLMKKYHDIGTPMNVIPLSELGALPVKNLTTTKLRRVKRISGEYIGENYLGRRVACVHCPVACIHIAAIREPYEDEPWFYKTTFVSYDYEPIYALGSMLGLNDPFKLLRLIECVEIYGLDAISTGVVLAWATEAYKKGIITLGDTIVELKWGDYEAYSEAVKYIVEQPNEFYRTIARGISEACKVYGGCEFALTYGGNEMPGYHTGPACHLGYAIGARHSHLDSAGYSLDQKMLKSGGKLSEPGELIDKLIEEESWRQILSSLVVCFFARGIYKPEMVVKALKPLGYEYGIDDILDLGRRIYSEKYRLKINLGFKPEEIKLPKRIFETSTPFGVLNEEYMNKALEYFRVRIGEITGVG